MRMLFSFLLLLANAGLNAYVAKLQKRDTVGWFLIGLLFGVFGLIALSVLWLLSTYFPKRFARKAVESDLEQDEDRILAGLDDTEENFMNKEWFFLDEEHTQIGPLSFSSLCRSWEVGQINESTYVWCEGMEDWERLSSMPVLQDAIAPVELIKS